MTNEQINRARIIGARLRNHSKPLPGHELDDDGEPIGETPQRDGDLSESWTIYVGGGATLAEVPYDADSQGYVSEDAAEAICEAGGLLLRAVAEIARLTAERDALHAAALDAIRAAWRSGYLAAMDDHETGENGDPDGCHDPDDYLQEAIKEPA